MTYTETADTFIASLGFEAYRVGGSVRDEILDRKVKDCDYMIRGARLDGIKRALVRAGEAYDRFAVKPLTLRDGQQGGWRVSGRGLGLIEIMMPRTEVSTGPRHQDFRLVVDPDLTLLDDAVRRDFTFNALYKIVDSVPTDGALVNVIDPTGRGVEDLTRRRINVTHADSFRDDPLRTLRALRFISTLGYELGAETRATMALHADAVTGLSLKGYASGTVLQELSKLLMGDDPAGALRVARDTGVLAVAWPELAPMLGFDQGSRYHDMTTDEHTFKALDTAAHTDAPLRVRMALLFHDSGKPATAWVGDDGRKHYYQQFKELTRASVMHAPGTARINADHEVVGERIWRTAAVRMGGDKPLREDVARLIRHHMIKCEKVSAVKVRRARVQFGDEVLRDLYHMRMCDLSGKGEANMKHMENIAEMERIRVASRIKEVPVSLKDLQINGRDVAELGVKSGKAIGDVLKGVLDEVVCDPSEDKLSRDWQLKAAGRLA